MKRSIGLLLALPQIVFAQLTSLGDQAPPATPLRGAASVTDGVSIAASTTIEKLSNDTPDWREHHVQVERKHGPGTVWAAGATRTARFGLHDTQLNALYSTRLSPTLATTVEATVSPTHRVLPRYAAGGQLHYEFAPAWIAHAGARSTAYKDVQVNQLVFGVERYVGPFSVSATARPARAFGRTITSAELRGSYYYAEDSYVSVLLADGREVMSMGTGVVLTEVRAIAAFGRHRLNRNWSVTYAAGRTRQGSLHTRNAVSAGVQYAF